MSTDVFAIQEEISRKIVSALQIQLTDAESRAVRELDSNPDFTKEAFCEHRVGNAWVHHLDRHRTLRPTLRDARGRHTPEAR